MRVDEPSAGDGPSGGDEPADGEAADDPAPRRVSAPETRDREECYRDLRADDEPSARPAASAAGDQPRFGGDGGWAWKGLELSPGANGAADQGLALRRAAEGRDAEGNYGEGGLTPAMRRVETELEHGTLVPDTEKFALKSPDRFKEKLARMIERYPGQPCERLVSAIHDGIRYTFLFPTEDYTAGVADATQALRSNGYDPRMRKPSWREGDYRGVNTRWCDTGNGVLFEVQFHTPESWEAKQNTHDIYEKLCDTRSTTPAEREQLEEQQRLIVAAIPVPPGVETITHYVKGQPENRD
jgi:hypothetical protein